MKQRILVLGADGLVGQTVFSYLHTKFPRSVWGTVRNKKNVALDIFPFSVSQCTRDYEKIYKNLGHIAYIINCIGVIDESAKESLERVNVEFPHFLEQLIKKRNTRLLHISTDAVFSPTCGEVTEDTTPKPVTDYGKSKLAGETNSDDAITIRTSFLGFDTFHKKGLLEKVLHAENNHVGYTNQLWSGCTTQQFAQFCAYIIQKDQFKRIRSLSHIFHFTPIQRKSKYQLVKAILHVYDKKNESINKVQGPLITRSLSTKFFDELEINLYTQQIVTALKQMNHPL